MRHGHGDELPLDFVQTWQKRSEIQKRRDRGGPSKELVFATLMDTYLAVSASSRHWSKKESKLIKPCPRYSGLELTDGAHRHGGYQAIKKIDRDAV